MILINQVKKYDGKPLNDIDFKSHFNGLLQIESLNDTFHQENADYTIEVLNKLSKEGKKKKIMVGSHPFKRLKINETSLNETLEKIRLQIKSSNENNLLFDSIKKKIPQSIGEDIRRLLDERKYFSALDLLKKQYFSDNLAK
jgi:hypothetical protein